MSHSSPKNIVIVGGSLGGLFAGVALKRLGRNLNIRIFERNPTPLLHDQGAGVVAQQDTLDFFAKHDRTRTPLTVTSRQRLYLDAGGEIMRREESVQQMTSWDLLYHLLRANYDGVESGYAKAAEDEEGEGKVSYEYGCKVTDIVAPAASSSEELDFSKPVELEIESSRTGDVHTERADLVIAADGPSSAIRSQFFPEAKRKYAGYVAWRGTVPEHLISKAAADVFVEKFVFFHKDGIQILTYLIPGQNGSLKPGKRLVNWVWYVNYADGSPEHNELMTDKDGKRHHVTLPPGGIQDHVWARQKEFASQILPPQFSELVQKTEIPFVQAITDGLAPSATAGGGRVLLLGDALANFRPHTAASTNQAALDAMSLAEAVEEILNGNGTAALKKWEKQVVQYAQELQRHGVMLGNRSQFGMHPYRG